MAARLLRCTALWGTADEIAGEPSLARLPEATYRPFAAADSWGLFADGRRVSEDGRDPAPGEAPPDPPEAVADGPFLDIGPIATHYGHFLLTTLPRLWPLATWQGPPPRLLCHSPGADKRWLGLEFIEAVLERLGCAPRDIVAFQEPMRLRDVAVPEPALREQVAMHAAFADLCRGIGRPLWQDVGIDAETRPLFLSKTRLRSGIGRLVNEEVVIEELERRGVAIAHPETLSFAEQVRLLSARRVVMGTTGSAFHTAAFAAPGRRILGLNWQAMLNANFALLDRVNGARARYYYPHGTLYEESSGWGLSWRVPDPKGVAAALLRRAEWLDRAEPDDEGLLAEIRRRALRPLRRR